MIGNRTDGATAFEATGKSKKTQGNRCFQHGGCLQRSKCLLCPAAAGKGVEPLNEYQKLVQDYVMVRTLYAHHPCCVDHPQLGCKRFSWRRSGGTTD